MTSMRRPATIAWIVAIASVMLMAVAGVLLVLSEPGSLWFVIAQLPIPIVGALIIARRFENPIGRLFAGTGIVLMLSGAADAYVRYSLQSDGFPGLRWTAWLSKVLFLPAFLTLVMLLPLLFPSGRLLSPRWRIVAWLAIANVLIVTGLNALPPGPLSNFSEYPQMTNPLGIAAIEPLLDVAEIVSSVLTPTVVIAAIIALVLRLRRSSGVERLQLKWFNYTGLVVIGMFILWLAVIILTGDSYWEAIAFTAFALAVTVGLPASVGIAIVRHQLYDIDRLINRTLVYLLLTAVLIGAYLALVLGLGSLARALAGETSGLITAASTLAVAALFRPLRARIQATVDRRFNRSHYDAARTLDAFSSRLRDEIDLDTLSVELRGIVEQTMQPAHVSLWLRSSDQTT